MIKSSLGGEEFAGENKGSSLQDIIASFNAAVINNMIKETEVSELEDESIPTLGDCIQTEYNQQRELLGFTLRP